MRDDIKGCDEQPTDEKELEKHQGELLLSIIFIIGSLWVIYRSVMMSIDVYNRTQPDIYTLPGVFPLIIGTLILLGSIKVLIHALKTGAQMKTFSLIRIINGIGKRDSLVFFIIIACMIVYVFFLIQFLPFEIATFIFILFLLLIFKATVLWKAILISAVFSLIVVYFFAVVVRTPFPITFF